MSYYDNFYKSSSQSPDRLRDYLSRFGRIYPNIWNHIDRLRAENELNGKSSYWGDRTFFPMGMTEIFLKAAYSYDTSDQEKNDDVIITALASWRITQNIYRFDKTVFNAVIDTPISGNLPVSLLEHLPDWCCYIETPNYKYNRSNLQGFFVFIDSSYKADRLIFLLDVENARPHFIELDLVSENLSDLVAGQINHIRNMEELQREIGSEDSLLKYKVFLTEQLSRFLSLTLYICSQTSQIPDFENRPQPNYHHKKRRFYPPNEPKVWEVSYRIGAALRKAQTDLEEDQDSQSEKQVTLRPHIRRAHWHGYWSGSRKTNQKFILKWLPPIPVNVSDENPAITTIKPVN
jgi:hypothetical protein